MSDRLRRSVNAGQCGAELRFLVLALGIQPDERTSDEPGQPGSGDCVDQRTPDHVTRNAERPAAIQLEDDLIREGLQKPGGGDQQQYRLQQTATKRRRQLGELSRIGLYVLVGMDTSFADPGEEMRSFRGEPAVQGDQCVSHSRSLILIISCSQVCATISRGSAPAIAKNIEIKCCRAVKSRRGDGVVKRAVPGVELDLTIGHGGDGDHESAYEGANEEPKPALAVERHQPESATIAVMRQELPCGIPVSLPMRHRLVRLACPLACGSVPANAEE